MNDPLPLPCPAGGAGVEPPTGGAATAWQQLCHRFAAVFAPSRYGNIRVVVAVSGGADSVALARLLHACWSQSPAADRQLITLAHFNHQLRGNDSDRDQQFVIELAKQLELPWVAATAAELDSAAWRPAKRTGGEAAWREQRYAFLHQVLQRRGARCLLTAHHADDQVETVLHQLFRGTGPAGLCGIASEREIGRDFMLYRPLLGFTGRELRHGLEELQQPWREDASNAQSTYDRNWIRHELLPQLRRRYPQADQAIGRLIDGQRQWKQSIDQQANGWIDQHVVVDAEAATVWIRLADALPAITAAGLARLWDQQRWPRQAMAAQHYRQLHQRLIGGRRDSMMLPGDVQCRLLNDSESGSLAQLPPLPAASRWWQLKRLPRAS